MFELCYLSDKNEHEDLRPTGEEKAKERFVAVHADMLDSILSKIKRQRNE